MKLKVPGNVLAATDCPIEFRCISDGQCVDRPMCDAVTFGNEDITFLKAGVKGHVSLDVLYQCHYVFSSGRRLICRCPVRYYLCKEYGI